MAAFGPNAVLCDRLLSAYGAFWLETDAGVRLITRALKALDDHQADAQAASEISAPLRLLAGR